MSTDIVNVLCINIFTVTMVIVCANTTHLIINGLMQESAYSFTVQAVDYGGRVGDTSESVALLLDGKVFIIFIISITLFNSSRGNTKCDIFHE